MLRPEFQIAEPAQPARPAAVRAAAALSGAGSASPSFSALHAEISAYIQHGTEPGAGGGEAGGSGAMALSAQARVVLARLQSGSGSGTNLADAVPALASAGGALAAPAADSAQQQSFLQSIAPWAEATGQQLGVAPDILAAQAALESGWGQRPLRAADGSNSHNLFGVKAGTGWQGESLAAATTEIEDGVAVQKTERFRRYDNTAGAFRDFARLLQESPRYQGALNTGGDVQAYAQGLVRGGYATDPRYADKLASVVGRLRARD